MISWSTRFVTHMIKLVSQFEANLTKRDLKSGKGSVSFTTKSDVQERGSIIPKFASESHQCCIYMPACMLSPTFPGESYKAKPSCIL